MTKIRVVLLIVLTILNAVTMNVALALDDMRLFGLGFSSLAVVALGLWLGDRRR